jgi:DNA-binding response OmpR family regulator
MLAGAREFLVKPFSSDELTASIRQVNERERERRSDAPSSSPRVPRSRPKKGRSWPYSAQKGA